MVETTRHRRVARLAIPWQLHTKASFQLAQVRLVDLSSLGARIEHAEPAHEGIACFVHLPPALGEARLVCRVVWSRPCSGGGSGAGDGPAIYQSGLEFVGITPEQQKALLAALEILQTELRQRAEEDHVQGAGEKGAKGDDLSHPGRGH